MSSNVIIRMRRIQSSVGQNDCKNNVPKSVRGTLCLLVIIASLALEFSSYLSHVLLDTQEEEIGRENKWALE